MLQLNLVGILALVAVAMCWSLAVVLYRVGTFGGVARKLSLVLVVEGMTLVSTGYIDLFLTPAGRAHHLYPQFVQLEGIIHTFGDCAMLVLYPTFLAAALQTPLTRPFEGRGMRMAIAAVATALFFAVFLTPLEFGASLLYLLLSVLFGFALVASIHAWRGAAGEARSRARAFAIAFGVRDVCWGVVYGFAIWMIRVGEYSVVDADASSQIYVVYALGTLLAVPLVAYGILRAQLFDIDLRIRWTIKQSTLAGIFVTIVYLVSEGAEQFLSDELGNIAGLLASALVVFFLAPLQRFAERVASAAMPNTQNTPEYAAFRKLQVYEAAVIEARQGEGISDKERALLDLLRDSLGISPADAQALEHELQT
ncbi:MAG: hypothetical protein MUP90_10965 [Gammaproteobacteria bacterium]|nr:hypothetical protein [Gammaproteobacteria bacterium]